MAGRVRDRLAELLQAKGLVVHPDDLHPVQGHYRTSKYADVCRWEGTALAGTVSVPRDIGKPFKFPPDFRLSLFSWYTMTQCIRLGIKLRNDNRDGSWLVEVIALEGE